MTDVSRANLIAAGVKGRSRAQELALATGLVPDTTPTALHAKSAANPAINAAAMAQPEEVA